MTSRHHFVPLVIIASLAIAASWSNHGGAATPPGRYTISNGTVLDTKTNLTWQQTISANSYTFTEAQSYCANLALQGTGWRAPSSKELQTIVDDTRHSPSIDIAAFPGTPSQPFWSSSPVATSSTTAWVVDFYRGNVTNRQKTNVAQVRCVR